MNDLDPLWNVRHAIMALCPVRPGLHDERACCKKCKPVHEAVEGLIMSKSEPRLTVGPPCT